MLNLICDEDHSFYYIKNTNRDKMFMSYVNLAFNIVSLSRTLTELSYSFLFNHFDPGFVKTDKYYINWDSSNKENITFAAVLVPLSPAGVSGSKGNRV